MAFTASRAPRSRTRREHRARNLARARARPREPLEREADLDAAGVPCRLFAPARGAPVAVYLHGGGWALGSVDEATPFCRSLAARSGWAVLAPDYRLAPEHPFPAALEDVERTVEWLRGGGEAEALDASRLALAGDSAGANPPRRSRCAPAGRRGRPSPCRRCCARRWICWATSPAE